MRDNQNLTLCLHTNGCLHKQTVLPNKLMIAGLFMDNKVRRDWLYS